MRYSWKDNPAFRQYEEQIEISKNKKYQIASKDATKKVEARRKVEELQEQKQLKTELDLWG